MPARGVEERAAFADAMALIGALLGAAIGLAVLFGSRDPAMAFHGALFVLAGALAAVFVVKTSFEGGPSAQASEEYMDGPIKVATIAAVFWGIAGFVVGDIIAWQLAFPALNFDLPWTSFGRLRPLHTSAVIFAFGGNVLMATSFWVVQRTCHARLFGALGALVRVLGLPALHRDGRHRLRARRHPGQGIRRARVVRRPLADDRLGRLPAGLPRHAGAAQGAAHLRRQLVLPGLHRHRRDAARRQQSRRPGQPVEPQELHRLFGRAGCDDAMVVRPQRGRLLPHRRLPRHHVLLHPQAGGAAGLFLPPVDRPLLDADLPLHLGRSAPPALHRAARLGADARHDLLDHAVDAVLGRHDQRPDDAVGRLGQAAHRSGRCACSSCRSPSTACRPSRGR